MLVTLPTALVLLTLAAPPVQDNPAPPPAENDPKLIAAYERLVEFLRAQEALDLTVRLDWKVEGQPEDAQGGSNLYRLQVRRPGRFRLEVRPGDRPAPTLIVVSDGQTVTTLYTPRALVSKAPRLDDPAQALERNPIVAMSLSGSLIDTLMRPDLVEVVRSHATDGRFEGTETVDGRELERYSLSWRGDREELWFGPGAEPLPRKLVRIVTVPTGAAGATRLVTTATLDWTLGGPVPEDAFALELPPDARQVDDIYAALASGTTATLLGGPAPELDLKRLSGGPATLAFHTGREVVVLDFWASWCAPCLDLLPKLTALLDELGDRGVVHYAINVGEPVDEVRAALDGPARGLDPVLDPDGRATDAYGITAIPALVLIGKDGTVQAVHRGGGEAMLQALRRDLEALGRGEVLVPPPGDD